MTAKRKGGRGLLARLEDLEAKEAARREEVRAWNWQQIEAAHARLSAADRAALGSVGLPPCEDSNALEDLTRQCAGMTEAHGPHVEISHPAKEEAEAWEGLALDLPDGVALVAPPAGRAAVFAAYFEARASAYDALAYTLPLSPLIHTLARICAALDRFTARLCEVLGGQA